MTSALIVLDVQEGLLTRYGADGDYLTQVRATLHAARQAHVTVIFVRVGFRPGFPEISTANKMFAALAARGETFFESSPATRVASALGRQDDEPIIVKKRVSAFAGSELELVLRAAGVDHLVLLGMATSGVVLSTVRDAADRDYQITVLADGCRDTDAEAHRVLLERVFPTEAAVMSMTEWTSALIP